MNRYGEDLSILQQNVPTGQEGVSGIERMLKDATPEVQNLLRNECDVIMECRFCRNMFRSILSFVSHKRIYCRSFHQSVAANSAAIAKITEEVEQAAKELREKEKGSKKNPACLKRVNLVAAVTKKINDVELEIPRTTEKMELHVMPRVTKDVPVTVFEDGIQKVLSPTSALASKESIPDDKVVLVMPQDHSSKYREMRLRSRRDVGVNAEITREISAPEIACLGRLDKICPNSFDAGICRCLDPNCTHVRPFKNISALAFHIAVKHVRRSETTNKYPCTLCNRQMQSWEGYSTHLMKVHSNVKQEHEAYRQTQIEQEDKRKNASKKHQIESPRARSLSPDPTESGSDESDEDEQEPPKLHSAQEIKDEKCEVEVAEEDMETPPELIIMTKTSRTPKKENNGDEQVSPGSKSSSDDSTPPKRGRPATVTPPSRTTSARTVNDADRKICIGVLETIVDAVVKEEKKAKIAEAIVSSERDSTPPEVKKPVVVVTAQEEEDSSDPESNMPLSYIQMMRKPSLKRSFTEKEELENEDSLIVRPTRNRKRPDWMMDKDFVMDDRKGRHELNAEIGSSPTKSENVPQVQKRKRVYGNAASEMGHSKKRNSLPTYHQPSPVPTTSQQSRNSSLILPPTTPRLLATEVVPSSPGSASRRKQNLNGIRDGNGDDDLSIISGNRRTMKPEDLASVPVYLSEAQKELFFSSLKPVNANDGEQGYYRCSQCDFEVPTLREGRRHMVTHIRVMRLRCRLCGAGSFFCTDLRAHLMERGCEKLHLAPPGIVKDELPCMSRADADSLSDLADASNPGRVIYTSGMIVSAKSNIPYMPDPVIEERILGVGRIPSSPTKANRRSNV